MRQHPDSHHSTIQAKAQVGGFRLLTYGTLYDILGRSRTLAACTPDAEGIQYARVDRDHWRRHRRHAGRLLCRGERHSTLYDLLGGRYTDEARRHCYRGLPASKALIQVSLGMARDFSEEPPPVNLPLRQSIVLGNISHDRLVLKHYSFDPTMAPPGHSVLSIRCEADYDYWKSLRANRKRYRAAKDETAEQVIAALEARWPGSRRGHSGHI
jgi:phytoene dehydrogenase-like protein